MPSAAKAVMASDNPKRDPEDPASNRDEDPDEWVSGDDPMTGAQASYLKTLCAEVGEPFDGGLTKAEASKRIDALRQRRDELRRSRPE